MAGVNNLVNTHIIQTVHLSELSSHLEMVSQQLHLVFTADHLGLM